MRVFLIFHVYIYIMNSKVGSKKGCKMEDLYSSLGTAKGKNIIMGGFHEENRKEQCNGIA